EDDEIIANEIAKSLRSWGFDAVIASAFDHIDEEFFASAAQLVIMDISLPYYNGYYWCERIRRSSKVPIVFLSSRADTADVVMAVNMGGDDYLAKPVATELLIAKVQAMLRRAYDYETAAALHFLGAEFDAASSSLLFNGTKRELTKNESRILQALLEKRGAIVSREELMLKLWDSDEFVDDNTLSVNVTRLRKTLSEAGLGDCVKTHKGQGYSIEV
ncbi:MAG: response regulator transcription factor, partial [Eubacteriales bacterium]|nr:response regulator transcription factor [Eubacteriales bacterium]